MGEERFYTQPSGILFHDAVNDKIKMKKTYLIAVIFVLLIQSGFGQGLNNDYNYDKEDLNFILAKLGFTTFKIPIKQKQNEYLDFIIEIYKGGKLVKETSMIEATKSSFEQYGIDAMDYFKPKMDSLKNDGLYFHRFYFHTTDTLLEVSIKTHNITKTFKLNTKGLSLGTARATNKTDKEIKKQGFLNIDKEKIIIFFYANNENEQPLWCPSGLDKEVIIKNYYYCCFVIAKPV